MGGRQRLRTRAYGSAPVPNAAVWRGRHTYLHECTASQRDDRVGAGQNAQCIARSSSPAPAIRGARRSTHATQEARTSTRPRPIAALSLPLQAADRRAHGRRCVRRSPASPSTDIGENSNGASILSSSSSADCGTGGEAEPNLRHRVSGPSHRARGGNRLQLLSFPVGIHVGMVLPLLLPARGDRHGHHRRVGRLFACSCPLGHRLDPSMARSERISSVFFVNRPLRDILDDVPIPISCGPRPFPPDRAASHRAPDEWRIDPQCVQTWKA